MRNIVGKFCPVTYEMFKSAVTTYYSRDDVYLQNRYSQIIKHLPKRATSQSAGYDICSPIDVTVDPNIGSTVVPLGIRSSFKAGWVLLIVPRSGLGFKYGLSLDDTIAVIDSDYEGQIMLKLHASRHLEIKAGDKIAQGIFMPFGLVEGDEINERGTGGFGSTGI